MSNVAEPETLSDLEEILEDQDEVVVEFGASWCAPCRAFRPHFDKFAQTSSAAAVYVDVQLIPETLRQYNFASVPQVMLFRNGQYVRHLTSRTAIALIGEIKL